jgi:small subunit ribosomal protein S7
MSRRHRAENAKILPDAKFGDRVLTKFMNNLMIDGKKSVADGSSTTPSTASRPPQARARRGVPRSARQHQAAVEVRSRRVGGATYQVPVEVRPERREALAIRWLINAAAPATRTRWKSVSPVS